MSLLRRPIRLQVETPSKVYATVDEVSPFGTATVRLATNGARLTNLPVHGQTVVAGQRVVVDYSSEGKPYVRPLTIITSSDDVITLGDTDREIEQPAFLLGRWTISDNRVSSIYDEDGYNYMFFDEQLYGTEGFAMNELLPGNLSWNCMSFEYSGKYLLSATVAIEARRHVDGPPRDMALMFLVKPYNRNVLWFLVPAGRRRRRMGDSGLYILNISTIWQFSSQDILHTRLSLEYLNTGDADWNFVKDLPKYPVLDIWRIAPDGGGPRTTAGWYWTDE